MQHLISTNIPFFLSIRLLINVTTPLEKLVDADRCSQSKNGRNLLKRLAKTSLEIKRTFLDYRTTQAIVTAIKAKAKKVHFCNDLYTFHWFSLS